MPDTSTQKLAARVAAVADADHALAELYLDNLGIFDGTTPWPADHELAVILNPLLAELLEAARFAQDYMPQGKPETWRFTKALAAIELAVAEDDNRD